MESDSEHEVSPQEEDRFTFPVGKLQLTGIPPSSCIGDDMRYKGSKTFRAGALQANGAGGPVSALVHGWCDAVHDLFLDVSGISETRLSPQWKHSLVKELFRQKGYSVISHNRPDSTEHEDLSGNSSGVILGIPSTVPGGLRDPQKDRNGRAVAASIPFQTSSTLRVVVIYGPTAANSYRFMYSAHGPREERELLAFATQELDSAFHKGIPLLALGDTNAVPSLGMDTEGGHFILREASLASKLISLGAIDTFRARHPTLRAFSYIHPNGTSSRLDHVWLAAPPETDLSILNAALINDERHKRDHLFPLVGLGAVSPQIPCPSYCPPMEAHYPAHGRRSLPVQTLGRGQP